MVITYHGLQCFKVAVGETTLVFNPISKKSKFPPVRFGADIAFVSLQHPDYNGIDEVTFGTKTPFVVDGPGEYEMGDVTARGYGVRVTHQNVSRFNTIYQVVFEGINMVFLGSLAEETIDPKILGELDDIDILFVPIDGGDYLDVPQASKLATKLEARCIIPMQFTPNSLGQFLKEEGSESLTPLDKLTVKKKDLLEMEGTIVVLTS